nr:MAG TPA: HIRAN protein [Caudoviricetes sp.]
MLVLAAIWFYLKSRKAKSLTGYKVYGDGSFLFDIVGEASYQNNLKAIAGEKEEDGKEYECVAIIRAEPTNPHDSNAIAVGINNKLVGYFDRQTAKRFHTYLKNQNLSIDAVFAVNALVVGGWDNRYSRGSYGVKLDVPLSFSDWNLERIEE